MADCVTIGGAAVAVRSVRDAEQGVYEYVEEQHPLPRAPGRALALPVRLSGWLWRREGLGIFRRYRRRFCVFRAQQAALFVFSDDDTVNGKLLRRLVLTRVTLTSRADRSFVAQGFVQDRELHKKASDSMARRAGSLLLPGDSQRFYPPEEERFKAVSAKACSVWTHCFKYHMKSYALRRRQAQQQQQQQQEQQQEEAEAEALEAEQDQEQEQEQEQEAELEMDPDFVFEDAGKASSKRRHSLPGSSFRSFTSSGSGLFSAVRSRSRSRGKLLVRCRESADGDDSDAPKSAPPIQFDQDLGPHVRVTATYRPTSGAGDEDLASRVATEISQSLKQEQGPEVIEEEENPMLLSELPCISSVWEDEELLSHRIDFDAIVKQEKLAAGACGEVWRAMHRSQEVVVKNLRKEIMAAAKSPTPSCASGVNAAYRSRRAILDFVEEIRIMSRLEHNRIVEFRGAALSSERDLLLVMEYLPRGDLRTYLNAVKHDEDVEAADALAAGGDEHTSASINASRYGSRARGTGRWMAPELLTSGAQSSMASDVYSFGIVLSEIDTCELPFYEREKLAARSLPATATSEGSSEDGEARLMNESAVVHKIVSEGWKPSFRVTCPEVIKKLAHDCLLPDPSARPTSLAVAHRIRKAAVKRERPEALAAQAKATTSLRIR
ncbi:TKL protein kinase [Phytophthora cinnamomi]|uniref:TKL protein kinase n=1 Tax=Phytophthora cinnamomi TaxID=4785 RepID=UPI003559E5DC|nr:TKL protein kinase [Phytophthora cinnamomi]